MKIRERKWGKEVETRRVSEKGNSKKRKSRNISTTRISTRNTSPLTPKSELCCRKNYINIFSFYSALINNLTDFLDVSINIFFLSLTSIVTRDYKWRKLFWATYNGLLTQLAGLSRHVVSRVQGSSSTIGQGITKKNGINIIIIGKPSLFRNISQNPGSRLELG